MPTPPVSNTESFEEFERLARKKWWAITIATPILVISFWAIVLAFIASEAEFNPGPPLAFGLALVPFVFVALAFGSRHASAGGAVMRAMLLWIAVTLPVWALAGDVATAVITGYGAGGVVSLRSEPVHSRKIRVAAVAGTALFVFVMVRLIAVMGLVFGSILVLPILGVADIYAEHQQEKSSTQLPLEDL